MFSMLNTRSADGQEPTPSVIRKILDSTPKRNSRLLSPAVAATESDDEILGEFDDDPDDGEIVVLATGENLVRIQRERESADDLGIVDVEIVDAGYTDANAEIMSKSSGPSPLRTPTIRRSALIWGRLRSRIRVRWDRPGY